MQSTRFLASNMLRMQPAVIPMLRSRVAPTLRIQPIRNIRLQASPKRMMPMPKEEHAAHTISQRLRTLKKIPPELVPLGIVLGVAIVAAVYSVVRKFYTDKTLRLYRTGSSAKEH